MNIVMLSGSWSNLVTLNYFKMMPRGLLFIVVGAAMAMALPNTTKNKSPNIVFIMADDLGWNDVSYHGSDQIPTPNIDMLAYSGVALNRLYTHQTCTPSRAATLSGIYAHKTGMQGYPIEAGEDRGLPINITIMPQYFKQAGYKTHLIGKWHVGASRPKYWPTNRGFDNFFGFNGPYVDYYEYTVEVNFTKSGVDSGLMLVRNFTPAWDVKGYITDVLTCEATSVIKKHDKATPLFLMVSHAAPCAAAHDVEAGAPLQAPPEVVRKMRHIKMRERRIYGAMVKKLDDSIGELFKSLYDNKMLDNTIIVFVSDNGAIPVGGAALMQNYGSNYPLRGSKASPFEGGVRVPGIIWSASLNNSVNNWDGYMHSVDWLPTLLDAAGLKVPAKIDGVNQWQNIKANKPSNRTTIFEINDYSGHGSVTYGDYKLITGVINPILATHIGGGDLSGIIGKAPSYTNALNQSAVYKIVHKLNKGFQINNREKNLISCKVPTTEGCTPKRDTVCLYNIQQDPCETIDISGKNKDMVTKLKALLAAETAKRIPRVVPFVTDQLAAPSLHNNTWVPWITS